MLKLTIQERDTKASAASVREKGLLPAVYYGPKEKPVSVSVLQSEFLKVWKEAGESTVIVLVSPKGELEVLIHEVAFDPVRGDVIHADFYVPEQGKTVEVAFPLVFSGVSAAVKDLGGTLVKVLHELEVEALPKDLPHSISVDISVLSGVDSQVLAGDIKLPAGVSLVTEKEEVVAAISVAEEEKETAAPADLSAIEVEKKGKKEEAADA